MRNFVTVLAIANFLTTFSVADESPIRVPDGFVAELYADDNLAHDIHSMTVNALGQIVVSGPGYIRVLLDTDRDGKADEFVTFANSPKSGAQGMSFIGRSLLCSGDNGLQLYSDKDADGKADGPPKTFLKIKAGGEHHAHSIQKGPDGWWYVIAGNYAGVDSSFVKLKSSPIQEPQAGVLMRLKPDLTGGEIVAHGFRNAYDFAFHPSGDVWTFDSDGERDVTMPWYRPCRIFHVTPRSHAGWVSRSWKRPDDFPDMMPTVAQFGRASPTGVVCYQHRQFPAKYRDAIFALDWTFGRVLQIDLQEDNGRWNGKSSVFAEGRGTFGFAPTDIVVGADGCLYVSVGGRGTRGGVYRIYHTGKPRRVLATSVDTVDQVLDLAQPLSSWSRTRWVPAAKKLGQTAFTAAAIDEGRPPQQRVRAIEILVSEFEGLQPEIAERLSLAKSANVRARCAWALGRTKLTGEHLPTLLRLLNDANGFAQRFAWESLMTANSAVDWDKCVPQIAVALAQENEALAATASRVVRSLNSQQKRKLKSLLADNLRAQTWMMLNDQNVGKSHLESTLVAMTAFSDVRADDQQRRLALRLLQKSLGDLGPDNNVPPMFESYHVSGKRKLLVSAGDQFRQQLEESITVDNRPLNREQIRCLTILGSKESAVIDRLLAGITAQSSPSDDIHRLAALSKVTAVRTLEQSDKTAQAIVDIDVKIYDRSLNQDSNWEPRFHELLDALCDADPNIGSRFPSQRGFGLPGHVALFRNIPATHTQAGIDAIAERIGTNKNYTWTNDVVFVLARSSNPDHLQLVRTQTDNFGLFDAVVTVLARQPTRKDRPLFLEALNSYRPQVVQSAVRALLQLPKNNAAAEQHLLIRTANRLNQNAAEYQLRESVVRLLQNNLQQSFGFRFGPDGHKPQLSALRRWRDYVVGRYPDYQDTSVDRGTQQILTDAQTFDWSQGSIDRGKQLFSKLTCASCHNGRQALGPDLRGTGKRFGRHDLLEAIVDPDKHVSSRYVTTTVETKDGRIISGLIVYESVDGLMLRDANLKTHRVEANEIESKTKRGISLMPSGLLKNRSAQEIIDLVAYLQDL